MLTMASIDIACIDDPGHMMLIRLGYIYMSHHVNAGRLCSSYGHMLLVSLRSNYSYAILGIVSI